MSTSPIDATYPPHAVHEHLHDALWRWVAACCRMTGPDATEQRQAIIDLRDRLGKRAHLLWSYALLGEKRWIDAELWHAVTGLANAGVPVRASTLRQALTERGYDDETQAKIGSRLALLTDGRTTVDDVRLWSDQIMRADIDQQMRAVVMAGGMRDPTALAAKLDELSSQVPQEVDRKAHRRAAIARSADPTTPPRSAISTGNPQLDAYLRKGFGVGEFTLIALSTNEGKSTIATSLARNVLWPNASRRAATTLRLLRPRTSTYVLLISLEDSLDLVYNRLWMDMLDVSVETLDNEEQRRFVFQDRAETATKIEADLYDDVLDATDTEGIGSNRLSDVMRTMSAWDREVRARDPKAKRLIIIDHVQCLVLGTREAERLNRERELSLIATALTGFARKRKVALVCTAMLNGRAGADMHDVEVRESAALEQAAHVSLKAHSCQSFGKLLRERVCEAQRTATSDQEDVLEARLALALECHTLRINKSRTTGGRGGYVTWRTQWDRSRITQLSTEEAKIVDDLQGDLVGWARGLCFNAKEEAPRGNTKRKRETTNTPLKIADEDAPA